MEELHRSHSTGQLLSSPRSSKGATTTPNAEFPHSQKVRKGEKVRRLTERLSRVMRGKKLRKSSASRLEAASSAAAPIASLSSPPSSPSTTSAGVTYAAPPAWFMGIGKVLAIGLIIVAMSQIEVHRRRHLLYKKGAYSKSRYGRSIFAPPPRAEPSSSSLLPHTVPDSPSVSQPQQPPSFPLDSSIILDDSSSSSPPVNKKGGAKLRGVKEEKDDEKETQQTIPPPPPPPPPDPILPTSRALLPLLAPPQLRVFFRSLRSAADATATPTRLNSDVGALVWNTRRSGAFPVSAPEVVVGVLHW